MSEKKPTRISRALKRAPKPEPLDEVVQTDQTLETPSIEPSSLFSRKVGSYDITGEPNYFDRRKAAARTFHTTELGQKVKK